MAKVHDHAGQFPPENLDWQALIQPMPSASNAQIIRVFILFFNSKKK